MDAFARGFVAGNYAEAYEHQVVAACHVSTRAARFADARGAKRFSGKVPDDYVPDRQLGETQEWVDRVRRRAERQNAAHKALADAYAHGFYCGFFSSYEDCEVGGSLPRLLEAREFAGKEGITL